MTGRKKNGKVEDEETRETLSSEGIDLLTESYMDVLSLDVVVH